MKGEQTEISMKLRNMTSIYLLRGDEILLLYRIGSRVIGNCYTGTAGGHFEPDELNDPRKCVLRELWEETGLQEKDLEGMSLRYVSLKVAGQEIRQNYYYFARLSQDHPELTSNEGRLQWVKLSDVLNYEMPYTAKFMMEHYVRTGIHTDLLYGGVATEEGVVFHPLVDQ